MSDHIADVRAQAEKEAERLWPSYRTVGFSGADDRQDAFIRGAEWLASRLTREKIAGAFCVEMDDESFPGKPCAACLQGSDAILALLTEEDHASNT